MGLIVRPKFKIVFFDRNVIKRRWNRMNKGPLQRAGLLVRKIARGSIKRGKKGGKAGLPGRPPKSRQPGGTPPFKLIFTLPQRRGFFTEQVVGMVGFGGAGQPIPGLQEEGGFAQRRVFVPGGQRRTKKGRFGRKVKKPIRKIVRYPKRPFMKPALAKASPKLPALWRNSLVV